MIDLRTVVIVGGCAAAHLSVGPRLAVPWLLPDVTWIGLVIAMLDRPVLPSSETLLAAGLVVLGVTASSDVSSGLAYLVVGWLMMQLGHRMELNTPARLWLAVGVGEVALLVCWMSLAKQASLALVGWSGVRLLVTVACVPLVRRVTASIP